MLLIYVYKISVMFSGYSPKGKGLRS